MDDSENMYKHVKSINWQRRVTVARMRITHDFNYTGPFKAARQATFKSKQAMVFVENNVVFFKYAFRSWLLSRHF